MDVASNLVITSEIVIKLEKIDTEISRFVKQEPELSIDHQLKGEEDDNVSETHGPRPINIPKKIKKKSKTLPIRKRTPSKQKCSFCGVIRCYKKALGHHVRPKYKCHLCTRMFSQNCCLVSHLQMHADKNLFECDKSKLSRARLTQHMIIHRTTMAYQCDLCPKAFKGKNYIRHHVITHVKRERVKCPECGISFTNSRMLKNHHKIFHTSFELKCKYCSKRYKSISGLKYHLKSKHAAEKLDEEKKKSKEAKKTKKK